MSSKDRFEKAMKLFEEVRGLPRSEHEAFLKKACGGDEELLKEVESLLEHDSTGNRIQEMLEPGAGGALLAGIETQSFDVSPPSDLETLTEVGDYTVIRKIGQGGMGLVFEAEQQNPQRRVAIKVVRLGLLSPELVRRFEHETHVLGQLHHPGIVHIYDAGLTELGVQRVPFFVMELVDGQPLDRFVEASGLGVREKLELVARVCDAVQHAHQKGIIHRDLKPGNIMVVVGAGGEADSSVQDSEDGNVDCGKNVERRPTRTSSSCSLGSAIGQPKILDFGIARATDADLQTLTLQTHTGQLIGTLSYMSPEQVAGDSHELDTRCDVYAIGVILYELLSGRLPHDLRNVPIPEAARIIRDEDPESLSSIDLSLRGDLDIVVAKAMEKDRDRRYASVAELAADLRRIIHDEPIEARAASTWYQLSKFARRNRGLVAGVVVAFLAITIGLAAATYGLWLATEKRNQAIEAKELADDRLKDTTAAKELADLRLEESIAAKELADLRLEESIAAKEAESRQRELAEESEREARESLERLEIVAAFQASMFQDVDPAAMGIEILRWVREEVAESSEQTEELNLAADRIASIVNAADLSRAALDANVLSRATEAAGQNFAGDPLSESAIRDSLGKAYLSIGLLDEARVQYERAFQLRAEFVGGSAPETLASQGALADVMSLLEQPEDAKVITLDVFEKCRGAMGADHPVTLDALNRLSIVHRKLERFPEALRYATQAYEGRLRTLGERDPSTLESKDTLGQVHQKQGDFEEAERLFGEVLEGRRSVLGSEHPQTLVSMKHLGDFLLRMNRLEESEPLLRESLEIHTRRLGEDHPTTMKTAHAHARLLEKLGKLPEAESRMDALAEARENALGRTHLSTLKARNNHGLLLAKQGKLAEAEGIFLELIELYSESYGLDHRTAILVRNNLMTVLYRMGRLDDAEPVANEVLESSRRTAGPDHPNTQIFLNNLARLQIAQGKFAKARVNLEEAVAHCRRKLPVGHETRNKAISNLADVLVELEKWDEAETLLTELLEVLRAQPQTPPLKIAIQLRILGVVYTGLGKFTEAEAAARESLEVLRANPELDDWHIDYSKSVLGAALAGRGAHDEAEPMLLESYRNLMEKRDEILLTQRDAILGRAALNVAFLYDRQGSADKAAEWRDRAVGVGGRD